MTLLERQCGIKIKNQIQIFQVRDCKLKMNTSNDCKN